MAQQSIYEFFVNKKVEKEVVEENELGKLTRMEKVEVPVKIVLQRPSRSEADEAKLVYAVAYADAVRRSLLTNIEIERIHDRNGYIKEQQSKANNIAKRLLEVQNEFTLLKTEKELSSEDNLKLKELEDEWNAGQEDLETIRSSMSGMFNSTAETFAEERVALWLNLFLTYVEDSSGQLKPFFKGDSDSMEERYKKKLNHLEALSGLDDEFTNTVIAKSALYISLWHLGKASTKEDFEIIDKRINNTNSEPEEEKEEPEKEQEVKQTKSKKKKEDSESK